MTEMSNKDKREVEVTAHRDFSHLMDGTEDCETREDYSQIVLDNMFKYIDAMSEDDRENVMNLYAYVLEHYGFTVLKF